MHLDPRLFYRKLICAARGVNVKIPWLFAFVRHMENGLYWAWKPRSATFIRIRTLFYKYMELEKNPPCNAKDNLRTRLVVIEAWFGGY